MSDPLLEEPKPSKSIMRTLRNSFLTGLVVTGPIGITILLITWFIGLLDSWFTPLIPSQFQPSEYLPFDVPGICVILALIIVFIVGALTTNFFGRSLVKFGENLISQTPIAGTIYNALRQIFKAAVENGQRSFSQVVLVEYPRKDCWAVGFITNDIEGQIADIVGDETVSVFVPTTPNPTSGFLLFYARKDVRVLDMSIEEGARLVISAGMTNTIEEDEA